MHQAMGGAQGQAEDIKVEAQQILTIQNNIAKMYASMTNRSVETIQQDLMRDNFMSAEEAKEYGLIDQVIKLQDMTDLTRQAVPKEQKLESTAGDALGGYQEVPAAVPKAHDGVSPD